MTTFSKKTLVQSLIISFSLFVLLCPIFIWFRNEDFASNPVSLSAIFPMLGLCAFTIMWLHVVGSTFETQLKEYINFEKFVGYSSFVVLVLILLHPTLFLFSVGFSALGGIFFSGNPTLYWLAVIGWCMLITYDLRKLFHKKDFVLRHWKKINVISTIGFFVIFFHAIGLGGDLQDGFLRIFWILLAITAFFATAYSYIFQKNF